jgi:hypothetical protein
MVTGEHVLTVAAGEPGSHPARRRARLRGLPASDASLLIILTPGVEQFPRPLRPRACHSPVNGKDRQPAGGKQAGRRATHYRAVWRDLVMKIAPGIHRIGGNSMINA